MRRLLSGCCVWLTCTILAHESIQVVQTEPQHVRKVTSYEWCADGKIYFLVKRNYWEIDAQTTRQVMRDGPSSHSIVLWSSSGTSSGTD